MISDKTVENPSLGFSNVSLSRVKKYHPRTSSRMVDKGVDAIIKTVTPDLVSLGFTKDLKGIGQLHISRPVFHEKVINHHHE